MKGFLWICLALWTEYLQVVFCNDLGDCAEARDPFYALKYGCPHACTSDGTCSGDEECLCDYKCGPICVSETTDCSQPQNPVNGYVTLPTAPIDNFGQEATFGCLVGVLYGSSTLRCLASGQWSGPIPQCYLSEETTPCVEQPPTMDNAQSVTEGGVATYSCTAGGVLEGDDFVVCARDGTWSTIRGSCRMPTCGPPSTNPPPPGLVQYGLDYSVGSLVFFDCAEGYDLTGGSVLACLADGSWSDNPPACEGSYCPSIVTSGDTVVAVTLPGRNVTADTTVVSGSLQFHCPVGYHLDGDDTCTCRGDLTWSCETVPACQEIFCLASSQEEYRQSGITYSEFPKVIFSYQEQITFVCLDEDSTLFGDATQTCVDKNQWSGGQATCSEKCTGFSETPANAERELSLGYPNHGGCVTFRCVTGYQMTGNSRFYCNDGVWSDGELPICTRDENGFHDYQIMVAHSFPFISETVIAHEWDRGLEMACKVPRFRRPQWLFNFGRLPSGSRVSHAKGDWYTLKFPKLKRQMSGNYSCVVHGNSGKYVNVSLEVRAKCEDLGLLENGLTPDYGTRQAGVFTSFECNEGYHILGRNTIGCQEDGNWSGPKPTCIKDNCEVDLPSVLHSEIVEAIYDTSEKLNGHLKISCNIGFLRVGGAVMECQNSQWIGQAPFCIRVDHVLEMKDEKTDTLLSHSMYLAKEDDNVHISCAKLDPIETVVRFRKYQDGSMVREFESSLIIDSFDSSDVGEYVCETEGGTRLQSLDIEMLRSCEVIDELGDGSVTFNDGESSASFIDGSTVRFECDDGFELRGGESITCADGEWDDEIPVCYPVLEIEVDTELVPVNGRIYLLEGQEMFLTCLVESSTPVSELVTLHQLDWWFSGAVSSNGTFYQQMIFDAGLRLRLPVATLDHSGTYTCGTPYVQGSVVINVIKPCTDIIHIVHGSVTIEKNDHFTATFECDDRYELEGHSQLTCLTTGHWDNDLPTCRVFACEPFGVLNGELTDDGTNVGQVVEVVCDVGFEVTGFDGPLTCLTDGTWDREPPTCTEKCTNMFCRFGLKCEVNEGSAECVCLERSDCEDEGNLALEHRVCASSGKTYASECHLQLDACEDPTLTILHTGTCVVAGRCWLQPMDRYRAHEQDIPIDYNKFYYDGERCQQTPLSYGVPRGAGFTEKQDCERICIRENFCFLSQDTGDCSGETTTRWSYNGRLSSCQSFEYSGCGGNENNFQTRDQCMQTCPDRCPDCEREVSLSRLCCQGTSFILAKITKRNRFQTGTIFNIDILQVVSPPDGAPLSVDPDTRLFQSHQNDDCLCPRVLTLDTPYIIAVGEGFPTLTEDTFAEPWTQELQSRFLSTASCSTYVSTLFAQMDENTCDNI